LKSPSIQVIPRPILRFPRDGLSVIASIAIKVMTDPLVQAEAKHPSDSHQVIVTAELTSKAPDRPADGRPQYF
jgi:hypothetical protein